MSSDPRHHLGECGESLAADHLARLGFTILARNYRTRWGELDIVAFDGVTLAFCEVKTRRLAAGARSPSGPGAPLDGLGRGQRNRLRKMAGAWLINCPERPRAEEIRCDAIGITIDADQRLVKLEHLEAAF